MSSKRALQFLEVNLDIEKLITEVQDRPALWDMTQKDYSDRIKRKHCWEEITEIFGCESDLSLDDKTKLGDILHKKWKNIRDRFTRDIQERKGKSGDGARKKAPYMYSNQLEFLRDTVTPKTTVNSLKRTRAESASFQDDSEENDNGDDEEEDELDKPTSASSTPRRSAPKIQHAQVTQLGKKKLHPVEEKILRSLDMYEKRAKADKGKEKIENDDNRYFWLSLVESLASLPRNLNTSCRIEIMQCINKYENMNRQHQQPLTYTIPVTHSHPGHQQFNPQQQYQSQQPHHLQPIHHAPMYVQNQLQSSSTCTSSNQQQSAIQQYPTRTFVTMPTPSPAGSAASYMSNFTDENDATL